MRVILSKQNVPVDHADKRQIIFDSDEINFNINTVQELVVDNDPLNPVVQEDEYTHGLDFTPAFQATVTRSGDGKTFPCPFSEEDVVFGSKRFLSVYADGTKIVAQVDSTWDEIYTFEVVIFNIPLGNN